MVPAFCVNEKSSSGQPTDFDPDSPSVFKFYVT